MHRLLAFLLMFPFIPSAVFAERDLTRTVAETSAGRILAADLAVAQTFAPSATEETLLTFLVKDQLGAQRAREIGEHNTPDVKWRLWMIEQTAGVPDYIEDRIAESTRVEDAEVREFFEQNRAKLSQPARYSFRHIFGDTTTCKSSEEREAVRGRIESAHARLLEPLGPDPQRPWKVELDHFNAVARETSDLKDDPTRIVGPFSVEEPIQAVIREHALALEPGEISPVFPTKHGFEIVRLESYVPAEEPEFEPIAADLRRELETTRRREAIEAIHREVLGSTTDYEIYIGRFVRLLPGAQRESATTTAGLRVFDREWENSELREYMLAMQRRPWLEGRVRNTALELTRKTFILPQLLQHRAREAGYVDPITVQARMRIEQNAVLTQAWIESEVKAALAKLPKPTDELVSQTYESLKEAYRAPAEVELDLISLAVPELTDPSVSPATKEFRMRAAESTLGGIAAQLVGDVSPGLVAAGVPGSAYSRSRYAVGVHFPETAWKKIESLAPGEWTSAPLRGPSGVFLANVVERVPERIRPIEEVRHLVVQSINSTRQAAIQEKLVRKLIEEARTAVLAGKASQAGAE